MAGLVLVGCGDATEPPRTAALHIGHGAVGGETYALRVGGDVVDLTFHPGDSARVVIDLDGDDQVVLERSNGALASYALPGDIDDTDLGFLLSGPGGDFPTAVFLEAARLSSSTRIVERSELGGNKGTYAVEVTVDPSGLAPTTLDLGTIRTASATFLAIVPGESGGDPVDVLAF